MFCRFCGEKIIEGSLFCSHCGAKIEIEIGGIASGSDNTNYIKENKTLVEPIGKCIKLKSPKGEIKEIELGFNQIVFAVGLFIGPLSTLFFGCVQYAIVAFVIQVTIAYLIVFASSRIFPQFPELQYLVFIFSLGFMAYVAKTFNRYRVKKLTKDGYVCADENSAAVYHKYIIKGHSVDD